MKRTAIALVGVLAVAGAAAAVAQVGGQAGGQAEQAGPGGQGPGQGRGMMGKRGGDGGWQGHGPRGAWNGDDRRGRMDRDHRQPSEAELDARIRERFARLDRNSDGVIDAAEVEQSFADRRGARRGGNDDQGRNRMSRLDTDKDGKLSRAEFVARVDARFKQADLNDDGRITDEDLPPMMRGRGVLTGAAGMPGPQRGRGQGGLAWLRDADANKDGQVTLDEVRAKATQRFDQMDRTKDGVVDQADRDALAKEMAQYRVQRFMHTYGAGPDGKVTREKFTEVAKQRVAEHGSMRGEMRGDGQGPRGPGRGGREFR